MKILNSAITTNTYSANANFKGKPIKCLEFHDVYEGQRYRNFIREHLMPYYDIYERECNKTKREMEMVLYNLYEKNELLNSIGLNKLKSIGNNSYRGAMVRDYNLDKLQKLKEAGIKHIIDLEGYPETEAECKKLGLDYSYFNILSRDEACWDDYEIDRLKDKKWYTAYIRLFDASKNRYLDGYGEDRNVSEFEKYCKITIEKLIKFVQTMQKGNVYIGCDHGTDFTDVALLLDYVFNPQVKHDNYLTEYTSQYLRVMLSGWYIHPLYSLNWKLNRQDYQRMGWYISQKDSVGGWAREQIIEKIDALYEVAKERRYFED